MFGFLKKLFLGDEKPKAKINSPSHPVTPAGRTSEQKPGSTPGPLSQNGPPVGSPIATPTPIDLPTNIK